MNLHKLVVKNYRSVNGEESGEKIYFKGVDCLVGKNNAGKTNILSAVQFLLDKPNKVLDEELYWDREIDQKVEVTGLFRFQKNELERIKEKNREKLQPFLKEIDDDRLQIGVSQIVPAKMDDDPDPEAKLVKSVPIDGELAYDTFRGDHQEWWDNATDNDHEDTKTDYRDNLQEKYEIVEKYINNGLKNKDSWFNGYLNCIDQEDIDAEYELKSLDIPSGLKGPLFEQLLPRPINIPAIREVESASQRGGEVGQLQNQISEAIQDTLDKEVQSELNSLREKLTKEGDQDRFSAIKSIEENLTNYLQQTFTNREACLTFPKFKSKTVLHDMKVEIDESHLDNISMKNVGEGVKRTVIFSLVRTLADLREEAISLENEAEEDSSNESNQRPLIILYEEADLFLHPQLQSKLLSAFNQLVNNNVQIIFSTHSPIMVRYETEKKSQRSADTINVVRKEESTTVSQFHKALENVDSQKAIKLTRLHRISSYIFADTVLLVEGDTDEIIFEKLAPYLNSEWDFNAESIPIIEVSGKDYVPVFDELLSKLGISAYSILDRDAIPRTIDEFNLSTTSQEELEDLEKIADQNIADDDVFEDFDYSDIKEEFKHMKSDAKGNLKKLYHAVENGEDPDEKCIKSLKTLIARVKSEGDDTSQSKVNQKMIMDNPEVKQQRRKLIRTLIEKDDIVVLEGQLEDYYPESGHSTKKAMDFEPTEYDEEELKANFASFPEKETTDIELLLKNVFDEIECKKGVQNSQPTK